MSVVLQRQTRADVKILPSAAQVTLVQCGDLSDTGLRVRNVDLDKRTRKNDTFDSTQNAPAHRTNKKKIQKKKMTSNLKIKKATLKTKKTAKRTRKTIHKVEAARTPIATKIATSPLPKTQIKRLTQEDWIEYIRRSTAVAEEKWIQPRFHVGSKCTEE